MLSVGTHEIALVLDDTFPSGISQTNLTVEVIPPAGGVAVMMGLIQASDLSRKSQQQFLASLNVAAAFFQRGNIQAGVTQLESFQRKVQQELMLSHPALANALIAAAQAVLDGVAGPAHSSPAEAVERIIELLDGSNLPSQREQPLLASLVAARASFERGNSQAGINQLEAFQHKVHAQVIHLDPALAQKLIVAAQQVVALAGGK